MRDKSPHSFLREGERKKTTKGTRCEKARLADLGRSVSAHSRSWDAKCGRMFVARPISANSSLTPLVPYVGAKPQTHVVSSLDA